MKKKEIIWVNINDMKPQEEKLFLVAYQVGNTDDRPEFAMAQYFEESFYFNDYTNLKSIKNKHLLMPIQPTYWAWSIQSIF